MKTYDVGGDPYEVEAAQIGRRRQLAELLAQQSTNGGPVYSNKAGIARLFGGLLSGIDRRQAEGEETALAKRRETERTEEVGRIFEANQTEGGRASLAKLLAQSKNPALAQAGMAMILKGPSKLEWHDVGDKRVATDEAGNVVREVAKGVSPDSRYGKETVGADTALTHSTPSAAAKLADERTRAEGAANRGVTVRGQNMTDERAREGLQMTDARARDATAVAAGGKSREDIDGIRKEFNALPEVKNFKEAVPVLASAKKAPDNAQGDLALVYAVGKVLDPNSVVREGEMALVLKSGSLMERVIGTGRVNLGMGGRLSPDVRAKLTTMLEQRVGEYEGQYNAARRSYEGIAKTRGYDPGQIFTESPTTAAGSSGWGIREIK